MDEHSVFSDAFDDDSTVASASTATGAQEGGQTGPLRAVEAGQPAGPREGEPTTVAEPATEPVAEPTAVVEPVAEPVAEQPTLARSQPIPSQAAQEQVWTGASYGPAFVPAQEELSAAQGPRPADPYAGHPMPQEGQQMPVQQDAYAYAANAQGATAAQERPIHDQGASAPVGSAQGQPGYPSVQGSPHAYGYADVPRPAASADAAPDMGWQAYGEGSTQARVPAYDGYAAPSQEQAYAGVDTSSDPARPFARATESAQSTADTKRANRRQRRSAKTARTTSSVAKGANWGAAKSALTGLIGGVIGSAAVTLALNAANLSATPTSPTSEGTTSSGPATTISAKNVETEVAKAVAEKDLPSVVSVYVTTAEGAGMGSGVILDTEGNILTNNHVAGDAQTISVTIGNKSYDAVVVGTDASSDLAVIKADLNGDTVTPIEVGDSDALVVGDWVATIGSPFGLDQSVSAGIVSSLSRNQLMQSATGNTLYVNLIQTDASINPGNSGGALVNEEGELVGISTLFSSDTESFAGIGFAIPGNYAIEVANKIIAGEQVTHAYIGLSMQTVNAQNAQQNRLSVNQGAYVAEVIEGSPAEAAGIQKGDIVIKLGDDEITSADGVILAVRSHKIGEKVAVTVMRGDEEKTFEVELASDEQLQKQQQEELERQQQQYPGDSFGNGYGNEDGYGDRRDRDYTWEDLIDYFFENRGGSYGLSE